MTTPTVILEFWRQPMLAQMDPVMVWFAHVLILGLAVVGALAFLAMLLLAPWL